MKKMNCWEYKKCGREPGGVKAGDLGVCSASIEGKVNGVHGGKNGGRCCWVIAGTLCGGKTQGTFAAKISNCLSCDFYHSVLKEEGKEFLNLRRILLKLK